MTRKIIHLESDSNVTLCGSEAGRDYTLSKDVSVRDVSVLWYKTGRWSYAICYECAKLYPLQVLSGSAPYHNYKG
jgi:hypothetical protein